MNKNNNKHGFQIVFFFFILRIDTLPLRPSMKKAKLTLKVQLVPPRNYSTCLPKSVKKK